MSILRIENLVVSYGNIKALKGISLRVEEGEVVSLFKWSYGDGQQL